MPWLRSLALSASGSLALALAGPVPQAAAQAEPPVSAVPMLMLAHVRVTDMDRAERFYREVFGMSVTNAYSPREHILRFAGSGPSKAGIALLLVDEAPQANGGFLIQVPDIDALFARIEAAGGTITRAPRNSSAGVRNGMLIDPDGTRIEVMQFIAK